MWRIGSFPQYLVWIYTAISEKPELTDGGTPDTCTTTVALLTKSSWAKIHLPSPVHPPKPHPYPHSITPVWGPPRWRAGVWILGSLSAKPDNAVQCCHTQTHGHEDCRWNTSYLSPTHRPDIVLPSPGADWLVFRQTTHNIFDFNYAGSALLCGVWHPRRSLHSSTVLDKCYKLLILQRFRPCYSVTVSLFKEVRVCIRYMYLTSVPK